MKNIVADLRKNIVIITLPVTILTNLIFGGLAFAAAEDERRSAHGISVVNNPVNGKTFLIWSDDYSGKSDGKVWGHDIYFKELTEDVTETKINRGKKALIAADEAQEPASASVSGDGKIIVTFEDGNDTGDNLLAQRYAIYDENLMVVKQYPATIGIGGHSGHASSTRNRHIVFWSEGWVNGGGIDNLGSGDDVWVTSLTTGGKILKRKKVAVGDKTRDWWPMTAASDKKALLLWQRYEKGKQYSTLCYALYDPVKSDFVGKNGKKTKLTLPHAVKGAKTAYYNYNVVWSKALKAFVVNYTDADGNGKILLIDENGKVKKRIGIKEALPSFVREALPIVEDGKKGTILTYPSSKNEYFTLQIKKNNRKKDDYIFKILDERKLRVWGYRGVTGFKLKNGKKGFISLSDKDVKLSFRK